MSPIFIIWHRRYIREIFFGCNGKTPSVNKDWEKNKYGLTPGKIFDIDTNNPSTTIMLKRGVASAYRHGINFKVGTLNQTMVDCAYQAVLKNITDRDWFIGKIDDLG